jgi:hypothetical protein
VSRIALKGKIMKGSTPVVNHPLPALIQTSITRRRNLHYPPTLRVARILV